MKINFSYKFKKMDGEIIPERPEEIVEKDGQKTKKKFPAFTLRKICVNVLLNNNLDEIVCPRCKAQIKKSEEISGEEKSKRFMLATKIYNGDTLVDIGDDDIKLLKNLISKDYPSSLIVGQAWEILDPHEAAENKKKLEKEHEAEASNSKDN